MTISAGSKLGPYEILAPIGAGGMGEVWKARDTRLGRIVAIKKAKEQHSERFKQEARSIAALNHPNICQLFDIGPNYLVLEYVEGKPLPSPLPEQEAVRLAIQIASALEEAHQHGIIHRDLKPSNIMVTEKGSVKLLDFGLAKLYEQDASVSGLPTADYPATQEGAILGTVAYMSPEQTQGQPVDVRSDIFSFGLVLYEMLSGERAFSGNTNYAVMDAIVRKEPPPLQGSGLLVRIVEQCLAKNPSARYQTMFDIRAVLEKILKEKASKSTNETQPSIAVLPFADMSPGKDNEWFSDGLAEEIINALTQIPELKVIARTSAFAFKGKLKDIRRIAKELDVANILEGSVRKANNRIRVTAQLINAIDGSHLWSQRYDRELTDVFAVQDEISQAIADRLRIHLSGDRGPSKRHTENVDAYNLYLKGRYHFYKFTQDGFIKSKENYEEAIAIDPGYALAWYGLAILYNGLGYYGYMPPNLVNEKFRQTANNTLRFAKDLPEASGIMGMLQAREYNWRGAELEFLRALDIDPRSEETCIHYRVFCLLPMRRLEETVASSLRSLELDPLSPLAHIHLAQAYCLMQQYDRAMAHLNNALELDPHYSAIHYCLGIVCTHMCNMNDGIRAFETLVKLWERHPLSLGVLGAAYARAGRKSEAQKLLTELQNLPNTTYVPPCSLAWIYLGLGEIDKGFDLLDRAVDEHDATSFLFFISPIYDQMQSHSRHKALLRKMNLQP